MLILLQCCLNSPSSVACQLKMIAMQGKGTSKKWRESLRVGEGGRKTSLDTWIEKKCIAADTGKAHELCYLCMSCLPLHITAFSATALITSCKPMNGYDPE